MCFAKLLRRPYFSRLWTIQEVVLGDQSIEVYSGYHHISWEKFSSAASLLSGFFGSFSCSDLSLKGSDFRELRLGKGRMTRNTPLADISFDFAVQQQLYLFLERLDQEMTVAGQSEVKPEDQLVSSSRLLHGLIALSARQCFDPRDRIFAIRRTLSIEN